ncbi:MAG: hypothetical protein IJ589_02840, partial [Lachnospiraceae bacterium]|nr:hypothetical protein [Lachnospiraceae bacterium]
METKRIKQRRNIAVIILLLELLIALITGIIAFQRSDVLLRSGTTFSEFENLSLKKGTYRLDFAFQSSDSGNAVTVISEEDPQAIQTDTLHFYTWKNTDSLELWVKRPVTDGILVGNFPGSCEYGTISLYQTAATGKQGWLLLCLTFLVADACYLWIRKLKTLESGKKGSVARALLLIAGAVFSFFFFWKPYIYFGLDTAFHLARIQGIAEGLINGEFPVRINTYWLDGAGVAIPVFYGDFLLYVPALFYLCGFTLQQSMKIYLLMISLIT